MSVPQPQTDVGLSILAVMSRDPDLIRAHDTSPELHAVVHAAMIARDDLGAVEVLVRAVAASARLHDDVARLAAAVHVAGPRPEHHHSTAARHRREWPALWRAIDALTERRRG